MIRPRHLVSKGTQIDIGKQNQFLLDSLTKVKRQKLHGPFLSTMAFFLTKLLLLLHFRNLRFAVDHRSGHSGTQVSQLRHF